MKLKLLVAAIAVAAVPFAAQADTKVSGDITAFYQDSVEGFSTSGSEVNVDSTNGNYFAHVEIDFNQNGETAGPLGTAGIRAEEMRIGVNLGGGSSVTVGEVDNACDQFDPGVDDLVFGSGLINGCNSADNAQILYKGKAGATEFAASHNPNAEESSVGARFSMGPGMVNLGYTDTDGAATVHAGAKATFGAVSLGVEVADVDGRDDTAYSVMGQYKAGGNYMHVAVDDESDVTLAYQRDLGNKTRLFAEVDMIDELSAAEIAAGKDDTDFAIGLRHDF